MNGAPFAAGIFARADIEARPGCVRSLRVGHPQRTPQAQARARRHSPGADAALGIFDRNAQESLGRGSHFAGNGRRRRVRPGQHPHPLPALPSRGNSSTAGANSPRQSSRHARRRSSRHPVAAIVEDCSQTCCTSARTLLTVEATLSSIPLASFTSLRLSADNPG